MTKECKGCREVKPLDSFGRCAAVRSGRTSRCRTCLGNYYRRDRERVLERQRSRRQTEEGRQRERTWQRERRKADPPTRMIQEARARAKLKGLEFDIDRSDIVLPATCPVLGVPIATGLGRPRQDSAPSIDRIDTTRGYVRGNVTVISWRANRLKSDATVEELRALVRFCESHARAALALAVTVQDGAT